MKRMRFTGVLAIGFITGVIWVAACGGSGAINQAIADIKHAASEISYDGTSSGLSASDVQAAIDALKASEPTAYTDAEAVAAMGEKANTNALNHDRYTDEEAQTAAVTAMGAKANNNPLNHDKYTDLEAQAVANTVIGVLGNDNPKNHTRYTDAEALAAIADQEIAGEITAGAYNLTAPKTGYITVPGVAFIPGKHLHAEGASDDYSTSEGARIGNGNGFTNYYAPIYLPNGATITAVSAYLYDNGDEYVEVRLMTELLSTAVLSTVATLTTDGIANHDGFVNFPSGVLSTEINNLTTAYLLKAYIGADATLKIGSVTVTYTYNTL